MVALPEDLEKSDDVEDLVGIVAGQGHALVAVDGLTERTGWDLDRLGDALADAEAAGRVQCWQDDDGVLQAVLTAWEASRRGVELSENGTSWQRIGTRPRRVRLGSPRLEHGYTANFEGDAYPCPPPPPPESQFTVCQPRGRKPDYGFAKGSTRIPLPRYLLGVGLPGSLVPGSPSPCPVCRGRKLLPLSYCLRCDRWGLDHMNISAKFTIGVEHGRQWGGVDKSIRFKPRARAPKAPKRAR